MIELLTFRVDAAGVVDELAGVVDELAGKDAVEDGGVAMNSLENDDPEMHDAGVHEEVVDADHDTQEVVGSWYA